MTVATPDWVKDAVFYQIFPDRFARSNHIPQPTGIRPWGTPPTYHNFMGGNLPGVVERFDYLIDLGVNAIYFNPVFASASNHRYHTYDYLTVDPILGGNAALTDLLRAARARNLRVILDGVFNHASRGFFQFNHLMECGAESPYVDWFHVNGWPVNAFREHEPANYAAWWGLHALPKFNTATPAVREFLWNVATYWLEQGIDGWRLDVPNEIDDDEFWREFRRRCRAVNPDCYIVGELWHDADRWLQGDQFDGQMNYPFTRAALGFFLGEQMDQSETGRTGYGHMPPLSAESFLAELTRMFSQTYHPAVVQAQMNMLGSHDTPRLMTLARGDRRGVELAFLCQMTAPGAPNLYYGDEIGLPGRHDPDNRRCFPWDEAAWNHKLRAALKAMIAVRRAWPVLRRGTFCPLVATGTVAAYSRVLADEVALVAFNTGTRPQTVTLPWSDAWPAALPAALAVGGNGGVVSAESPVTLPARSGRVWVARR